MIELLFLFACSYLNRLRGGGYGNTDPRTVFAVAVGTMCGLYTHDAIFALITGAGIRLWAMGGWGLYFSAAHGQWAEGEKEIRWIDWVGMKLFPFVTPLRHSSNFKRGILCMGLRGASYSLPLFVAASYFYGIENMLLWPVFFLQGVAYFAAGRITKGDSIWLGERIWGVVFGGVLLKMGIAIWAMA